MSLRERWRSRFIGMASQRRRRPARILASCHVPSSLRSSRRCSAPTIPTTDRQSHGRSAATLHGRWPTEPPSRLQRLWQVSPTRPAQGVSKPCYSRPIGGDAKRPWKGPDRYGNGGGQARGSSSMGNLTIVSVGWQVSAAASATATGRAPEMLMAPSALTIPGPKSV